MKFYKRTIRARPIRACSMSSHCYSMSAWSPSALSLVSVGLGTVEWHYYSKNALSFVVCHPCVLSVLRDIEIGPRDFKLSWPICEWAPRLQASLTGRSCSHRLKTL